jgi:hypothetical protein
VNKLILAPFDDETQKLLNEVDSACRMQSELLLEEMSKASLAAEEYKMPIESMVWWKVIQAYGVLMNRAIDAGWVDGILTEIKDKQ